MKADRLPAPVPLRDRIRAHEFAYEDPCDMLAILGSFWPSDRSSFESHIVKCFKECCPVEAYQPHIGRLCEFYADLVMVAAGPAMPDWIVRVLSSSEKHPDPHRPLAMLVSILCKRTGARDGTDVFFRSESRPPMRRVEQLSGPEALDRRIRYVSQDLFLRPRKLGGSVLLVDDIYNTGATVRTYAHGLKELASVRSVTSVNLAATRFAHGKDGHGMLELDISGLLTRKGLQQVWLDSEAKLHTSAACESISGRAAPRLRFAVEKNAVACPVCGVVHKKRWWQLFGNP